MDWRQLQRELKAGKISNLYVVYGEDTWQVDRSRSFLTALIPPTEQEYNVVQIDGARMELSELEMHLQLSLLGERKLLMIENLNLLKPRGKVEEETAEVEPEAILRSGPKEEAVWLDRLVHSDHMIVLYGYHALDARRRFTKQILASAAVVECPMLRGDAITRAVRDFFLTRNLRADFNLVSYIGQLAGSQLGIAEQEIEKLALVFSTEKSIQLKKRCRIYRHRPS